LAKYNSAGTSYVEVDDSGGTPRDLSPYADFIDFCGRDFYDPTVSIKEIVIQGPWDDKASTGSDVVLAGILGAVVTVSYGPAGNSFLYILPPQQLQVPIRNSRGKFETHRP
jgi:hypothetical protein